MDDIDGIVLDQGAEPFFQAKQAFAGVDGRDGRFLNLLVGAPVPGGVSGAQGSHLEQILGPSQFVLLEETGVKDVYLEQLYSFGDPKRDPRARVISVAYFALVEPEKVELRFGSDAKDVAWFSMKDIPPLAFDHKEILNYAYQRLIWKLEYTNVVYSLLPRFFTLTQLQQVYETILDHPLDKRNFRRKFIHTGLIVPTGEKEGGAHRPAEFYRFVKEKPTFIQNPFGQFLKK